jgi:RHS repeat-associated protein
MSQYDTKGMRITKDGPYGKTVYIDTGYVETNEAMVSNHVFMGNTRVASIVKHKDEPQPATYYYASDHLGSSSVLTTDTGSYYERLEYLPYGEVWVEDAAINSNYRTPYKFTGKELDKETGLYYFGARYYDARMSRWISTDPALEKYFPKPNDYDTEHDFYWYILNDASGKLPGMGGVFNAVNLDIYHYAGNNPVKIVDPDGNSIVDTLAVRIFQALFSTNKATRNINDELLSSRIKQWDDRLIPNGGSSACFYRALQSIAESYAGKNLTSEQINEATQKLIKSKVIKENYYVNNATAVIEDALNRLGVDTSKLTIDYIRDVKNNIPEGTIATIRGVPSYRQMLSGNTEDVGHYQHGDAKGGFIWDPWNGQSPINRPVNRIDAVIIKRKEE